MWDLQTFPQSPSPNITQHRLSYNLDYIISKAIGKQLDPTIELFSKRAFYVL